jgi:hypothetical protein
MTETNGLVEKLWPLPLDYDPSKPEDRMNYFEHLRKKYGTDLINQALRLKVEWEQSQDDMCSEGAAERFFDFLYGHGLCEDWSPRVNHSSRLIFNSLQKILSPRKEPFTIADIGAGSGRYDIALALSFSNLREIYAIDCLLSAIAQVDVSMNLLNGEQQETARRKVIPVRGNYQDSDFIKRFTSNQRVDLVLNICPTSFDSFPSSLKFINPEGSVINYSAHWLDDGQCYISETLEEYVNNPNFSLKIVDSFGIDENRIVVASEVKRKK